ncbi:MAG TPA: 3-isopropylmalate dehydratase large subunit [Gammaproteobacteria bacterium]|jgi:3-isopropylmalate/(R)-2-methylmalate dehydratase large subunit|nr:3-isopropylmalate dehydratase large subunit [Gammaproteobacteria bacterium]
MAAQSLFEKVWASHIVAPETDDTPAVLYVDLHLIHEVTSPQAFDQLRARGLRVRRPDRCLATLDHSTPTVPLKSFKDLELVSEPAAAKQVRQMEKNCEDFGIELRGFASRERGIVHVIGPELGASQPGTTIVCGDSHTSTHGALGSLAFGIGTTEVGHVLATQCLLQRKPKTLAINLDGKLAPGVTAKDVILRVIGEIGVGGGTGHVIEYRGSAIRAMSMEERMTVCNMSIEAGARAGMIAPDDTTYQYLNGRPLAPKGAAWESALRRWRALPSDAGARFDNEVDIDVSSLGPMVTFGTNPGMVIPIGDDVPRDEDPSFRKALAYMQVEAGKPLLGKPVDVVFIGSCTNGRLSDLRQAAGILRGRHVADRVRLLVVPGSHEVKRQAEAEGLDEIVRAAGGEWREPGCSMCIAMNGDKAGSGQLSVSTSNRNFEGRQGSGARTVLASPLTAAAAAIKGAIADPRDLMG